MTTKNEILERVLKDLRYYQQYGAKVILETAIFDLEHVIKEPPASKPLTQKQVDLIMGRYDLSMVVGKDRERIIACIRDAEAAHGIKGEQHG